MRKMKTTGSFLLSAMIFALAIVLESCGGGGTLARSGNLVGKVFKIVDLANLAGSAMQMINKETSECQCKNDYAYIIASSDRKKGVTIYIDNVLVGEVNREQAFLQVVSPGSHLVVAKDNKRDKIWEQSVTVSGGEHILVSFNKDDWEKDPD